MKQEEEITNFTNILKKYIKHWYVFAISVAICVLLAFVYLKITSPIFHVEAKIKGEEEKGVSGIQAALLKNTSFGGLLGGGDGSIHDDMEALKSHTLLSNVAKTLDLNTIYAIKKFPKNVDCYHNSPLELKPTLPIADTLSVALKFNVKVNKEGKVSVKTYLSRKKIAEIKETSFPAKIPTMFGDFLINPTQFYEADKDISMKIIYSSYGYIAEVLTERIQIDLVTKKANIILLSIDESCINRGKDILNTLISKYNERELNDKRTYAKEMEVFFNDRVKLISDDLERVEKDIEVYKTKNKLTDITAEAKIIIEKNGDFKEKMIEVETQYSVISTIDAFLKDPNNKYAMIPMSLGIADKNGVEALQKYNGLLLERLKLLRSTHESNPTVHLLNEQIEAMHESVMATIKSIKDGIEFTRNDLRQQENEFYSRIKNMPTQEREFITMKRQQYLKQEMFVFMLQQKEENAIKSAISTPKMRIVDHAYNLVEPLSPKPLKYMFIACVMGCILAMIFISIFYRKQQTV